MKEKIVDLIEMNKDVDGETLPIEKEMIIKSLGDIPHDIAKDYCDYFGAYIEEQLIIKNIISSSDRPYLIKHLIDKLSDSQLARLSTIVTHLASDECENKTKEIVNAALGISFPSETSKMKASELVSLVKALNINHEAMAKELAEIARLITTFCNLLVACRIGEHVEACIRDRLAMIPEDDLDWLLKIGVRQLAENDY